MLSRFGLTVFDLFGILLGLGLGLYILIECVKDVQRGERKTAFDADWLKKPSLSYWLALALDLSVGLFLLYAVFLTSGFYLARVALIMIGYGLLNHGISKLADHDSEPDDSTSGYFGLGCGLVVLVCGMLASIWSSAFMSFVVELLGV